MNRFQTLLSISSRAAILWPRCTAGAYTRSQFSSTLALLSTVLVQYDLAHERVLELLKLSSYVKECTPLECGLEAPPTPVKMEEIAASWVWRCRFTLSNLRGDCLEPSALN